MNSQRNLNQRRDCLITLVYFSVKCILCNSFKRFDSITHVLKSEIPLLKKKVYIIHSAWHSDVNCLVLALDYLIAFLMFIKKTMIPIKKCSI